MEAKLTAETDRANAEAARVLPDDESVLTILNYLLGEMLVSFETFDTSDTFDTFLSIIYDASFLHSDVKKHNWSQTPDATFAL